MDPQISLPLIRGAVEADTVGAGVTSAEGGIFPEAVAVSRVTMAVIAEGVTVADMGAGTADTEAIAAVMAGVVMGWAVGDGVGWDWDCILRRYRSITTRCGQMGCLTIIPTAITSRGTLV